MAEVLSEKRQQILTFIADSQRDRGYPPSVREIGEAVGLASSATVHTHLAVLQREGYLSRDPSKPRAIQVHYDPTSTKSMATSAVRNVPLVGDVAAGTGVLALENVEELLPMPEQFTGTGPTFMLRVRGDSMMDAGIFSGDFVVVRQQPEAENGDIVVAGHPRRRGHGEDLQPARRPDRPHPGQSGLRADGPRRRRRHDLRQGRHHRPPGLSDQIRAVAVPLLEQARHPPVGQHLPARLARGAVGHLVATRTRPGAGRRDSPGSDRAGRIFPWTAKRPPSLASDSPPVRVRSRASASASTDVVAASRRSRSSALSEPRVAKGERRARWRMSSPQPRPDAGDDPLIAQVGVESPRAGARADQLGEGLGVRFGSQALQRPLVARGQNPPRRLALGPVLADQDRPLRIVRGLGPRRRNGPPIPGVGSSSAEPRCRPDRPARGAARSVAPRKRPTPDTWPGG